MSKKIAMIGPGSVVFCETLMTDILAKKLQGNDPAIML